MVQVRRATRKAVGAGSSSTTEARSTALPACSDGFDNVDGGPECGVYIQMRGVEQGRVGGRLERCYRAFCIALVTPDNIGQNVSFAYLPAGTHQFGRPPARAYFRGCVEKQLYVGIREDLGTDVAT